MLQLACAFVDSRLKLSLVLKSCRLCGSELVGHLIESEGKCVEFLDATARNARVRIAVREPFRRDHEFADRRRDAPNGGDRD